jgi:hypothetical protein
MMLVGGSYEIDNRMIPRAQPSVSGHGSSTISNRPWS